jgi:AcrR family transcriptional regulator
MDMTTHSLSRVAAWRYVDEHGDAMPGAYDRDGLLADLAAHAGQRLVARLDAPLEHEPPGSDRLRQVLTVWLDLARATPRVRAFLEREATGRARAQLEQQRRLVVDLLAEDLAALEAPDPRRSAVDLLREADAVAALEDAAARPLRRERAALLAGPAGGKAPRPSLARRLHLVPA